jgi:hypothetical protein
LAGLGEALGDVQHAVRGHFALVRTAEDHRDHALAAQPLLPGPGDGATHALERLGDRAVHVAAVVTLGRREEHVDLAEALPVLQRALEAALVGNQDRV